MSFFMITIILIIICIIRLVLDNSVLYSGAYKGLLLWYERVIPLLLPFIIISSLLTKKVSAYLSGSNTNNKKCILPALTGIMLGLLCGCPIGAKSIESFYSKHQLNKKISNLLLPLCNTISPIFLSGYIYTYILGRNIALTKMIIAIYLPNILYALIFIIYFVLSNKEMNNIESDAKTNITETIKNSDPALNSIIQIAYIGLYIILCSIIIEFIMYYKPFNMIFNEILCGATEITTGAKLLAESEILSENTKSALILSATSFGGICALLQTRKAINGTRLSMLYYTVVKLVFACCTYKLAILIL